MAYGKSLISKEEKKLYNEARINFEKSVPKGTFRGETDINAYNVYFNSKGELLGGGNRHERRRDAK